ncbi:MAG TPA: glycogen synthase GlgA [Clostridiales bacterium]|nr:glycogen synthase GlgA [Clostridiales bacterium]
MQFITSITVPVSWRRQYCGIFEAKHDGVIYYLLDNQYYFKRGGLYGYYDDAERFAFFSRAVLEIIPYIEFVPDIIHCNDWQTAMIPVFLKDVYFGRPEFAHTRSVYTIHNLKYQGVFSPSVLEELLGLGPQYNCEDKLKYHDGISFMKGGIVFSDRVTTVSETYAKEIQTPYYGEGLDGLLRQNSYKLVGITNGIDYGQNNPKTDPNIVSNYTSRSLQRKAVNKTDLQKTVGLPENPEVPILSMITRLVRQKGIDLVTRVMEEILKMDIQFVLLGTGDQDYQDFFEYYAYSYPGKVSALIRFDNVLASKIYAGSDLFLMPSLFEPCGLSQMIAMAYGTLPIVRETGGLRDTVTAYNEFTGEGNGFSFTNYNAHDMLHVIEYAVAQYKNREAWQKLVKNAMNAKYDWNTQSAKYLKLYRELSED